MAQHSRTLAGAFLGGLLGLLALQPASADELVLRGAVFSPLGTTWGEPMKMFIDRVNETGKGVLQIQPIGPDAMPATEQPNALRSGLLDLVATPPGMYKQMFPEANAQDLSNMTLEEQKASGGYEKLRALTRQKLNAQILTTYGPGVHFHLYLTKDVAAQADLKGMRVRSQPIFGPFFTALGLGTTTIPIPETYTALERGVVQGYGFPAWGVQDLGWDRLTKVRVEPGFYNVVVNILMNETRLKALDPAQRKVIDDAVVWFDTMLPGYMAEKNKLNADAQQAAGIKPVDFGPGFSREAEDVYWDLLAKDSPETIPMLRGLLQK